MSRTECHLGARGELHMGLWWEIVRERDHLEDLGVGGRILE